jgi:hypothetical protein
MRKKETLNLRVSSEFKRRLVLQAKRERRSVTNYLEVTLERLWNEHTASKASLSSVKEAEEQRR